MPQQPKKLLDQVRDTIRTKHYSYRTEQSYVDWVKRYIFFHKKRHPADMGADEVQAFLTHLAVERNVSASTQNQALSALLFLYRHVLHKELSLPADRLRAKQPKRLPTVLSKEETLDVINQMSGAAKLMAQLLYGSGLRLMECLRFRVKDIDFANHEIIVRDGNGEMDRVTILPDSLVQDLHNHLRKVKKIHAQDVKEGYGEGGFVVIKAIKSWH